MFSATSTRPSLTDQIVIFGGWRRWRNLQEVDKGIKEDALWRAIPARSVGIGVARALPWGRRAIT